MSSKRFLLSTAVIVALSSLAMAQKHHATAKTYKISSKQAASIALKKYHGKVIGKVALENEEGTMQYSVNVRTGKVLREVMVDANSGKIASVEITTRQKEAKEEAAEKRQKGGK